MSREEDEVIILGKLTSNTVIENSALRRHINHTRLVPLGYLALNVKIAIIDGLTGHNHSHASAVGGIVCLSVLICRVVADVMTFHLYDARRLRASDDALGKDTFDHLGEQSHYVKSHINRRTRGWV